MTQRRSIPSFLAALAVLLVAAPAAGQDAPAPSLEVPTDAEVPYWALAVSTDPLAMFFGEYGAKIEGTLGAAHSIWVEPSYLRLDGVDFLAIEVGYHLWPLAQGVHGLFIGPAVGAAVTSGRTVTTTASLEAGYQYVWDGIVLGIGGGATCARTGGQEGFTVLPRVTLSLGYAWM